MYEYILTVEKDKNLWLIIAIIHNLTHMEKGVSTTPSVIFVFTETRLTSAPHCHDKNHREVCIESPFSMCVNAKPCCVALWNKMVIDLFAIEETNYSNTNGTWKERPT